MASLLAAVPARFTTSALRLAYSTAVHGVSVSTFYARTRGAVPALLVARDGAGGVFGAYTTAEWRVGPRYVGRGEAFVFRVGRPGAGGPDGEGTPAGPPAAGAAATSTITPGGQAEGGGKSDQAGAVATAAGAAPGAAPPAASDGEVHPAGVIVYRWTRKNPYFQLGAERHLAVGGGGGFALWLDDEFRGTTAASDTFGSPVLCLEGGREGGGASTPLAGARVGSHTILDPPREERRFECVVFEAWALETAVSTLRGA